MLPTGLIHRWFSLLFITIPWNWLQLLTSLFSWHHSSESFIQAVAGIGEWTSRWKIPLPRFLFLSSFQIIKLIKKNWQEIKYSELYQSQGYYYEINEMMELSLHNWQVGTTDKNPPQVWPLFSHLIMNAPLALNINE